MLGLMSKDDNTIGSWGNKPLPYDKAKKDEVSNIIGLVKLTQPDYFLSYLEESGIVPKGYSKLSDHQKVELGGIIAEWERQAEFEAEMREMDEEFLESQTSDTEEGSEE